MDSTISLDDFYKALAGKTSNFTCRLELPLVLIRIAESTLPFKEKVKKQMLADEDDEDEEEKEEEAGTSSKKLKKGGQQKITFPWSPKQQQPTLHPLASWDSSSTCSSWGSRA